MTAPLRQEYNADAPICCIRTAPLPRPRRGSPPRFCRAAGPSRTASSCYRSFYRWRGWLDRGRTAGTWTSYDGPVPPWWTAHAERWISPWPGTEAALLLAVAHKLLATGRFDREFVERWTNWRQYLADTDPDGDGSFDRFIEVLLELYAEYTPEHAEAEWGVRLALGAGVRRCSFPPRPRQASTGIFVQRAHHRKHRFRLFPELRSVIAQRI